MKIMTFRVVSVDWIQDCVAFSFNKWSLAFYEMFSGREPLPVQRHSKSLPNSAWCIAVLGSWPSKILDSWALNQRKIERPS